jgi:DNA-binding NarL/FixJ family response regulator
VLAMIVDGLDNSQIAGGLHLSTATIKHHVAALCLKLEVDNRVQAAVRAVREDLVEL